MFSEPKYGLTLGGGGARGGAHLGVLRVLREVGYRPDVVVGTSIGGLVAAMIGFGWSLEQMEELFFETDFTRMVYLDRGGNSLIGVDRFGETLRHHFGDADLRDLSPKIAVVATDIQAHCRVLIDSGPVVRAILATTAVPGLFPPVKWNDYLLVDGGVTDNVPTQATYQLGAERVVAVNLAGMASEPDVGLDSMGTFNKYLQRAFYWLLSLSRRQTAFDTVMQSMNYSQNLLVQYHLTMFPADVLIAPNLAGIGLFSMEAMAEAALAGEQAARQHQAEIKKLLKRRYRRSRQSPSWPLMTVAQDTPEST